MQGHTLSVSNLALHPTKPLVASASDDRTWKLWQFVDGELIMTGEGHTDWISGIDFHPRGLADVKAAKDNRSSQEMALPRDLETAP